MHHASATPDTSLGPTRYGRGRTSTQRMPRSTPGTDAVNYVGKNKDLWNEWTEINARSAFYDVAGFKRKPTPLDAEVLAGVGDVHGRSKSVV